MRIAVRRPADDRSVSQADDGFSLIEVVVAMALIVFTMTATTSLFVGAMASSGLSQQRQSAVAVADYAMEQTRAVPAASLTAGRDATRNNALWAAPGSVDISQSVKVWDTSATGTSTPTVPFTGDGTTNPAYQVNNVSYTVRTFVDGCYLLPSSGVCNKTQLAGTTLMYRVTVEVRWTPGRGDSCGGPSGRCEYIVSTLRDPSSDYPFNLNRPNG